MSSQNLYFLPSGTVDNFNVVIEIPHGSQNKYELDAETGALFLDRVLYGAAFYPGNYGFIPSTKAEDGDAADVIVFMTNPVPPKTVVKCRAVGIIKMEDSGDLDSKILAVPNDDTYFNEVNDIEDLPTHKIKEITDFFENMQKFKKGEWKRNVNKILSVENKESAQTEVARYLNNYPSPETK
jgi:inorganic pyrophosphatase